MREFMESFKDYPLPSGSGSESPWNLLELSGVTDSIQVVADQLIKSSHFLPVQSLITVLSS